MSLENTKKRILYFLTALILVSIVGNYFYRKYELKNHSRFTVCTTTDVYKPLKSSTNVRYIFTFKNKTYNGKTKLTKEIQYPGGQYFVRFSESNPNVSELVLHLDVMPGVNPPDTAWLFIPKSATR